MRPDLAAGIASIATTLSLAAGPLAACDPSWLPIARPAGSSAFVAIAAADSVLDTVRAAVDPPAEPCPFGGRLGTESGFSLGGQRVRLPGDPETEAMPPEGTREAIVVPWAYGPDCRPIRWRGPLVWIPAGTRGVITGWLRPRERWLAGLPTFDVEMAWREPLWTHQDSRWAGGAAAGRLLTPEEFLELYSALPEEEELAQAPTEAAARMRAWERSHQELADRMPARTILDNLYRAVAERVGP